MKFYSTNNKSKIVTFQDALIAGQPPELGLYVPTKLINLEQEFTSSPANLSFQEISLKIAIKLLGDELHEHTLMSIIEKSFPFSPILRELTKDTYILELFHGPTLAFKDFGARFMAQTLSQFLKSLDSSLTILVATSGDTGSAVANAFYNVPKIKVVILYPSGGVSILQEKQLTTLGGNVVALEVKGSFDDCQRLAKHALANKHLNQITKLSSANSINVGRLLPQSFYYIFAQTQLHRQVVFSVPSGNFGNLTAGLYAKKMGLPVAKFIAATNKNDIVPKYLQSGEFVPQKSVKTLSNAMDVGNPSNFTRILELYENDVEKMSAEIWGTSVSDQITKQVIQNVYNKFGYVMDPHTAVGYEGLQRFRNEHREFDNMPGIVLSTAHPAKFRDIVEDILDCQIEVPERLAKVMHLEKKSILIEAEYRELEEFLLSLSR